MTSVVSPTSEPAVLPIADSIKAWVRPHQHFDGGLSEEELKQFWEQGFVLKKNLFEPSELQDVIRSIEGLVDELAEMLYAKGKITDKCENLGFYKRLTAIEAQFPSASVLIHKKGVLPESFGKLWTHPKLLAIAKQVVGPDVAAHPVWNLRSKVPRQAQATVPWHQDNAYLHPECWEVLQLTAWIPLIDANAENGCMQVVSGGHRLGQTLTHNCCAGGTWYVSLPEEEMEKSMGPIQPKIVTCEVPFGSVLFLNNLIPHQSLENYSDNIRWSLDLRFQHPDKPNGFYGLKDSLPVLKSSDPNYAVDWSSVSWAKINRQNLQEKAVDVQKQSDANDPELDTTIAGPWMQRWHIVNHNKHTEAAKALLNSERPIDKA